MPSAPIRLNSSRWLPLPRASFVHVAGPGWVSLDPTHNRQQTCQYVRVAIGHDYADVPPTRGVFKGQAKETLDVKVSVLAL